ncbi:MAG: hypothetical protein KKC80_01110 [Candidatus Margulisbacteria bacterium]|nr:hypothetical protein [Candidatus Margulisiibacteriota bacterium]
MSIRTSSIANHARVVNFVRRFAAPAAMLLALRSGVGCEKSSAPIDARCVNLPAAPTPACPTATAAPTVRATIVATHLDGIKGLVPTLPTPITIGRSTNLVFTFPAGTTIPNDLKFSARLIAADNTSPIPLLDQNVAISGNTVTISNVTLAARPGKYTVALMAYDRSSNLDKIFSIIDIYLALPANPVPTSTGQKPPAPASPRTFCDLNPGDSKCNF